MLTEPNLPQIPEPLRRHYPFRTRKFAVGKFAMSFVDEGAESAPPVVLLHGNLTWSFLYRRSISKLAERFRVIAPDLIGFGLSDKPADSSYHTLEQHVSNLTALIDGLALQKITLALHDWGVPIGLGYATVRPENISRVLLMNTWWSPGKARIDVEPTWAARLLRSRLAERFGARDWALRKSFSALSARRISPEILDAYTLPFHEPSFLTGVTAFLRSGSQPGTRDKLQEILSALPRLHARTEIIWGTRGSKSKLPAYLLRDSFPNAADPVFVETAGHLVPEDAAEQVTDKLLEIFKPKPTKPQQMFNIIQ